MKKIEKINETQVKVTEEIVTEKESIYDISAINKEIERIDEQIVKLKEEKETWKSYLK